MINNINFTHRYIAKYWQYLINEILKDINNNNQEELIEINEKINNNNYYAESLNNNYIKYLNDNSILSKNIISLINYIEKKINTKPILLKWRHYYTIDNIIIVPLHKTQYYNSEKWYLKDLTFNKSETMLLIKYDLEDLKFIAVSVAKMPYFPELKPFDNKEKYVCIENKNKNKMDNKNKNKMDNNNKNKMDNKNKMGNKNKMNKNNNYKCIYPENAKIKPDTHFQTECINNNGSWTKIK